MQTYRTFRPTSFDPAGIGKYGAMADRQDWLVMPVTQTRDSGVLERSNFRSFLRALGGESKTVEVHRFGHWGPGWFEIIIVDPADETTVQTATALADALADYPIVDENDHSELEWETAAKFWASIPVSERVDLITRANTYNPYTRVNNPISVFAARRDELPEDPNGRLFELLTRD